MFLNSLMKSLIVCFAFVMPPSIGTRRMFLLQPRQRTVKPKRNSRTVAVFGNSHDGHLKSIVLLSRSNISVRPLMPSSEQFLKYISVMMLQSVGKFVHVEHIRREPLSTDTNRELWRVFVQIKQDQSNAEEHTQ